MIETHMIVSLDEWTEARKRLLAKEKAFIVDLRTRALGLKQQGVDAEQAGRLLTTEFKNKYPDWPITTVTNFVKSIYAEKD